MVNQNFTEPQAVQGKRAQGKSKKDQKKKTHVD